MSEEPPQSPPSAPEREPSVHQHGHSHLPTFTFLEELKRRNVGRVAILYIILGYVVLEVFGVFVHLLDLPTWVGRSAVLLVVVGFPVALLIAWVYEITPEGLKPTEQVAPHQSIRHLTGRRLDRAIIAVLAIALSYFVVDKFWLSRHPAVVAAVRSAPSTLEGTAKLVAAIPEKSIAVLPFLDMSEKHDQEYFSDGLAEELIEQLGKTPDLKVIARTSSFSFKGKTDDIATIAAKLKVANVLEGSVRRAGDHLRVSTQLIRADSGAQLWSESFDREFKDVFRIQDEITSAVVSALKLTLAGGQTDTGVHGTTNAEAYNAFLLGRQIASQARATDLRSAIEAYQRAIRLDPHYADAYAELAYCEYTLGDDTGNPALKQSAEQRAQKAIDLDPNRALGYTVRGYLRYANRFDWVGYEADYQRALKLEPTSARVLQRYALMLGYLGHQKEAEAMLRKSIEQDPLYAVGWSNLGEALAALRNYPAAYEAYKRALAIAPGNTNAITSLGTLQLIDGKAQDALATFQRNNYEMLRNYGVAMAEHSLGNAKASQHALDQLIAIGAGDSAYQIAEVYAWRGERDKAFEWLERAYRQQDGGLVYTKIDPLFASLRSDPRNAALLRKLNFPP